jgi:diaminohydroxyphosphoribosylaminopyrimidine deaminase / 5-amino-6-(5-phosphoribosylamino)uracil reductase
MWNKEDEKYMRRCLELARLGLGDAAPNPMVGSVIVHCGKIIGEGYHQKCGEAHAEVNAINSVKNKSLLKESTIYVNLEPCSHYGKTPPCADLIIEKKIPRVVIGCMDSFTKVAGNGIKKLKKANCDVITGVLEKESLELNRRFFAFHEKKRPYIILKWAQTLDGFIDMKRNANETPDSNWITNNLSKMLVHKWRTEESAFMIGTNTARNDNPQLTVRDWNGRNPIRIVLDRNLRLNTELHIFNSDAKTLIFNTLKDEIRANIEYIKLDFDSNMINTILEILYRKEIQSMVVEGGQKLLKSFINQNLWDEARVFTGNKNFYDGIKSPEFRGQFVTEAMLNDSHLTIYKNSFKSLRHL